MQRHRLLHCLMGIVFAVIVVLFFFSEGNGRRDTKIECLSFSPDGSQILVSNLAARDAQVPGKAYKRDIN